MLRLLLTVISFQLPFRYKPMFVLKYIKVVFAVGLSACPLRQEVGNDEGIIIIIH